MKGHPRVCNQDQNGIKLSKCLSRDQDDLSRPRSTHPQDTTDNTRALEGNDQVIRVAAKPTQKGCGNKFYCCKGSAT